MAIEDKLKRLVKDVDALDATSVLTIVYEPAHGWSAEVARRRDPQLRVHVAGANLEQVLKNDPVADLGAGRWGRSG